MAEFNTFALIQIALDIGLFVCLALLVLWLRRGPEGPHGRRLYKNTEEFLAASEELAARFEENLNQKRALVRELVQELEAKTKEMKRLLAQAEESSPLAAFKANPNPPGPSDKEAQVLRLFRQGRSAAQIATQMRLPRGEVEVILSLHAGR